MVLAARPVFCRLPAVQEVQKLKVLEFQPPQTAAENNGKIVLQPRVCTLRSFGGDRGGVIKAKSEIEVSRFFETLTDYIESSRKSQDFEIISGRLAMIVFAATVGLEIVTGNSVFKKIDIQGIEEAAGVCFAAITSAAIFAWSTSNRNRVGSIFTVQCNTFIDSLIDQIIDGLFYEIDISDWSDEI
ncbi:hypothetical protein ACJIZ3_004766 [Penstemon smallii]|uniref:Stress enhanced protein 2 n=1 Tax=Penstemon smallii TaxID=265156 RepID=A0ABD3S363_9LAMI